MPLARPRPRPHLIGLALAAIAALAAGCTDDSSWGGTPPIGEPTSATTDAVNGSLGALDAMVERAMDDTGVPGVAVAVVHGDEVVHQRGFGVRSAGSGEPVRASTVFQIASMSKPISSTIMSGLVGSGTIAWDDPLAEGGNDDALADLWVSERVTYADLFSHRSGLPGASAGNDLEAIGYGRDTILDRLDQVPLGPFRDQCSYSNWGMTLAGDSAADVAGTTWEQLADDVLFEPAGMTSTSMRHEDFLAREDRATLHSLQDGQWEPVVERRPDPQAPAGGVSSNVVDLARWVRLQLAGGALDGAQIIDPDALDKTHTPLIGKGGPAPSDAMPANFYGLGWNITTDAAGNLEWNHSGAFSAGAATVVKVLPGKDLGIVVLTNGAPIGVPEAIADEYLELVTTGTVSVDWLGLWGERFSGIYGEPIDTTDVGGSEEPGPTRSAGAYEGTYANDYVGEVEVVTGDAGLEVLMGPDRMAFPLRRIDGDRFTYLDAPELPDFPAVAEFTVGASGVATALTLSSLDASGLGTLTRT